MHIYRIGYSILYTVVNTIYNKKVKYTKVQDKQKVSLDIFKRILKILLRLFLDDIRHIPMGTTKL